MIKITLTKRIIPCLDVKNGRVVKGINFTNLKDAGDPVELGKKYSDEGADELVYLDVSATLEERQLFPQVIKSIAKELDIPFTVGGGIRTIDDALNALSSGADKISLNTAAVNDPNIITEIADVVGKQCVVIAIDAKKIAEDKYDIHTHSAKKTTGIDALRWAQIVSNKGAGELLVTSIEKDGTSEGFSIDLLRKMSSEVSIPVIASGGAKNPDSFLEVFRKTNVDAALAASIFHYNLYPITVVKDYLRKNGVNIR